MLSLERAFELLERSMKAMCDIPENLATDLFHISRLVRVAKGSQFVRAGDISRTVGFNLDGIFRYYYLSEEGTDYTKAFSTPGKFLISYSALAQGRASYFSIEALTDADILVFGYDEWMRLVDKDLRWYQFLFKLTESVYIMKELREKSFLLDDAASRYEGFRRDYPGLEREVKQYHVASFLGITPEALSRIRKDMKLT
jgi:CRP-like cAMP-binding protein